MFIWNLYPQISQIGKPERLLASVAAADYFYNAILTSRLPLQGKGEDLAPGQDRAPLLICENLRNLWMINGFREKHAAFWR